MSYYSGDFYQGDYRGVRGDPGFLSFIGKFAKKLLPAVPIVGPAASTALSLIQRSPVGRAIVRHPTLSAAATAGAVGIAAGRGSRRMGASGVGPVSMGGPRMRTGGGGAFGRRRRMRVTNVKALRRAIRRARGFEKLARKVMHFVSPRKAHGRAIFRVRRKK